MPHMDSTPFSLDVLIEGAVIALIIVFVLICVSAAGVFDSGDD